MKKFKLIEHRSPEYEDLISLRDKILREPLGLKFLDTDLAKENDSLHLAGYTDDQKLMCCLVLKPISEKTIKMRQVAVAETAQGKGWGTALVKESERIAKEKGYHKMICHARDHAIPFYMKLDYFKVGDEFEEVTVKHFRMEKNL